MRSDTDATRVADCFILDFPCLCEASGSTDDASSWRLDGDLRQKNIGTPLVAAVNPGPPGCVSAAIGARNWLRARTTASPIKCLTGRARVGHGAPAFTRYNSVEHLAHALRKVADAQAHGRQRAEQKAARLLPDPTMSGVNARTANAAPTTAEHDAPRVRGR